MAEDTHTDWEIAIERELHGALDRAQAALLAEHLLGCASCGAYQKTAIEMEMKMEAIGNVFSRGVMWSHLESALDERTGAQRTLLVRSASTVVLSMAGLLAGSLLAHELPTLPLVGLMALMVATTIGVEWSRARRITRMTEVAKSTGDLFAALDQTNRRDTRRSLASLIVLGALGMCLVANELVHHQPLSWTLIGLFAYLLGATGWRLFGLRRERMALLGG